MSGLTTGLISLRRLTLGLAMAAWAAASALAQAPPVPSNAEDLALVREMMAPPDFGDMHLSPDGKRIVATALVKDVIVVIVIDADTLAARTVNIDLRDTSYAFWVRPWRARWVDNELLAVDFIGRRSFIVDLDGKRLKEIGERFARTLPQPGWILVYESLAWGRMAKVEIRGPGQERQTADVPGDVDTLWTDRQGNVRLAVTRSSTMWSDANQLSFWWRRAVGAPWERLLTRPITEEGWWPDHVPEQPDSLVVRARVDGDRWAMARLDTRSKEIVETLVAHPKEDIVGLSLQGADRSVNSATTGGLKPVAHWFDEAWARLQRSLDQALPGRINRIVNGRADGRVLIQSRSDIDPGRWYLLDVPQRSMKEVAEFRVGLKPAAMRPMQTLEYPSFDGLPIPAYLTLPAGEPKALPLVVLVHGGPAVRDYWGWDPEVQMLARQGYAVFQPQFRGSSGFGQRFEKAGRQQWGRAMQDDIGAGVRHLVERGIVDGKRVCIVGGSYGGYAALWASIKTPELYRCAASINGVSDLRALVSTWQGTDATLVTRQYRELMIGDPERDRAQLDAVSPLLHAERVRLPLLVAHSLDDQRVRYDQSERFVERLQKSGKPHTWLPLREGGHNLDHKEWREHYYTSLLAFLRTHLATRP